MSLANNNLFQPIELGNLKLRNRVVMVLRFIVPMVT